MQPVSGRKSRLPGKTKGVIGAAGRVVDVKRLELLAKDGDAAALKQLVNYVSISYEFRTRINAIQALKRLDYFDADLGKNLLNAAVNPNHKLAGVAADLLRYFDGQHRNHQVISDLAEKGNWSEAEKLKIQRVLH